MIIAIWVADILLEDISISLWGYVFILLLQVYMSVAKAVIYGGYYAKKAENR